MSGGILIIDDDHDFTQLAQIVLEARGYAVRVALDARRGLALALSEIPDLILLDHSLPGKSGLALLADLRATPELEAVPVIMITGHGVADVVAQAVQQRVSDFVVKPFDIHLLLERIARWAPPPNPASAEQEIS
jgi:DNA-binding response OmpR family regulator